MVRMESPIKATTSKAETTVDAALSSAAAGIICWAFSTVASGGKVSSATAETRQIRELLSESPPNLLFRVHRSSRGRPEVVSRGLGSKHSLEEAREAHLGAARRRGDEDMVDVAILSFASLSLSSP